MDKRSSLLTLLDQYKPFDLDEIRFKNDMIAFVQEHEDCFERTLVQGHVTASAWIISKEGDSALLMHHAKLDRWFQLGGHCDGNPDVLAVAMKEAQEESGIKAIVLVSTEIFDIDIHLIPANSRDQAHYHYDVRFLLQVTSDEVVIQNNESKALRWIPADPVQLPTNSRSVVRMFEKWALSWRATVGGFSPHHFAEAR